MNSAHTQPGDMRRTRTAIATSTFAMLTLFMLAPAAQARRPMGTTMTGTIQHVDHASGWITFIQNAGPVRQFVYNVRTKFWHNTSDASPKALKVGLTVELRLHKPLIGPDFVNHIVLIYQTQMARP